MKRMLRIVVGVAALGVCLAANAESTIVEVFQCTVNDGATVEQVDAANAAWLRYANANVDGGGIESAIVTAVVGDFGQFLFVDTFPSLAAWAEAKAVMDGTEYDDAINEVSTCTSNTLYESNPS